MSTSERLRALMNDKGISVHKLAASTSLSLSTIRRLRKEDNAGNVSTWQLIADALNVSIADILGGER